MKIQIRDENPGDAGRIHQIIEAAFRNAPHADHTEQFIVAALRDSGALTVSLVADRDGESVGHVALSPVRISDGSANWFGLGPLSVLPKYQGQGVGSELVKRALASIQAQGAAGCVVLGDPAFYARFGFMPVAGLTLSGVPPEYFQALAFGGGVPRGEVSFHAAFSAQA